MSWVLKPRYIEMSRVFGKASRKIGHKKVPIWPIQHLEMPYVIIRTNLFGKS